jgi:hypothetical protein
MMMAKRIRTSMLHVNPAKRATRDVTSVSRLAKVADFLHANNYLVDISKCKVRIFTSGVIACDVQWFSESFKVPMPARHERSLPSTRLISPFDDTIIPSLFHPYSILIPLSVLFHTYSFKTIHMLLQGAAKDKCGKLHDLPGEALL